MSFGHIFIFRLILRDRANIFCVVIYGYNIIYLVCYVSQSSSVAIIYGYIKIACYASKILDTFLNF